MPVEQLPQGVQILRNLSQIGSSTDSIQWQPFREGVEIHRLYGDGQTGPTAALLKFQPGAVVPRHEHIGYEHIIVLSGSQTDDNGDMEEDTLVINPPNTNHAIVSKHGCIVLAIYEKPVVFH